MHHLSVDCIIVAAGSGTRLGAQTPKAFVALAGKPLFVHSLLQFAAHNAVRRIILVVPPAMMKKSRRIVSAVRLKKELVIVNGGEHRWLSVKNGVEASQAEWVMVHDSARPFVTRKVINDVLGGAYKYDAVIAATPEIDTVRYFSDDCAGKTLDRSAIVRVQTPQLFKRRKLLDAFKSAETMIPPPTDEAMLMEAAGIKVGISRGDPLNFKITTREDLVLARAVCKNTAKRRLRE
jgi:2-C-methyl-D-erythritol 4-phosphate cytidylyltransferase